MQELRYSSTDKRKRKKTICRYYFSFVELDPSEEAVTMQRSTASIHSLPDPVMPQHVQQSCWSLCWKGPVLKVHPQKLSAKRKAFLLFIVCFNAYISHLDGGIYLPALLQIQETFQTTETAVNASNAIFMFATGVCPLLWGAASETYGRRPMLLISLIIAAIGNAVCGVSVNIAMLIVFRFVSAAGSSTTQSVVAGVIADVYFPDEQATCFCWFATGVVFGSSCGPLIGGGLTKLFGWRSVFYFMTVLTLFPWILTLLCMPETLPARLRLQNEIKEDICNTRQDHADGGKISIRRIFSAFELFKYPNIFISTVVNGIYYGLNYLIITVISWAYGKQYHLSPNLIGVCVLVAGSGVYIGNFFLGRLLDNLYRSNVKEAEVDGKQILPEIRIHTPLFILSLLAFGLALAATGWLLKFNVHVVASTAALFVTLFGFVMVTVILDTYIISSSPNKEASALACNNCVSYVLAALASLLTSRLVESLGYGILCTGAAVIAFIFSVSLVYVKNNASKWQRVRGPSDSC
ncbi:major facilitator superfamily domain-containing protein [Syncephalastrum racemosum]|uniref:Major facilitator superfamily domain-containing protein n=1 Tax=Syncephalastrum racemosum TaxID=13706 RepID=A0A1X2HNZ5_SYNRA|nr:major facilitator superfamily domain-containing protein [Syncephalastrum racemosum]